MSEAEEDAEHRLEALWASLMKRAKFEAEVRQEAADLRLMRERDRLAGIVEQVRAAIGGHGTDESELPQIAAETADLYFASDGGES